MATLAENAAEVKAAQVAIDAAIVAKGGTTAGGLANAAAAIAALPSGGDPDPTENPKTWNYDYSKIVIDLSDCVGGLSPLLNVPWMLDVTQANAGVTVDYGDGSAPSVINSTGTNIDLTHQYTEAKVYVVSISSATPGLTWRFSEAGVCWSQAATGTYRQALPFLKRVKGIAIGTSCNLCGKPNGCFRYLGRSWIVGNPSNPSAGLINTSGSIKLFNHSSVYWVSGFPSAVTGLSMDGGNPCVEHFEITSGTVDTPYNMLGESSEILSITIPDGVKSIGNRSFYACEGLLDLTLPESVETLATEAFRGCNFLKNLYMLSKTLVTLENINTFTNTGIYEYWRNGSYSSGKCTIHVPSALVAQYEADTNWAAAIAVGNIQFVALQEGE